MFVIRNFFSFTKVGKTTPFKNVGRDNKVKSFDVRGQSKT